MPPVEDSASFSWTGSGVRRRGEAKGYKVPTSKDLGPRLHDAGAAYARDMEHSTLGRSCLVAVDGTAAGVDALVWALRHAAAHDTRVDVLTVWPDHHSVLVHEVPGHFCAARWDAVVAQEDTIRRVADVVSTAPIRSVFLENSDVAVAFVRASASHDLVVLGAGSPHGRHGLTDRIIDAAACDVVVVALSHSDSGG
jgi:hypothetical protein